MRGPFPPFLLVSEMASNSKQTSFRRKLRHKKAGRKAKSRRENRGTTPVFPIHTPEADANAPEQAKPAQD